MNSYGLPKGHRPVRLPTSYGPGPLVGITLWSHAYGRSSYLRVVWSRGCKIPYVYLKGSVRLTCEHPKGPCGFHTGIGTSVRSVLREPYDPVRTPCGLGNICAISGAGPLIRDLVRPASARSDYIYQAKHDYVTSDPLGPGRLLTGLLWARNHW